MRQVLLALVLLLLANIGSAEMRLPNQAGKEIGIKESDKQITKVFTDSAGSSEVLTVFKGIDSKISWQLENRSQQGAVSSRIKQFRDGSQLAENFDQSGKLVSRVQTDKNGKTRIQNF